MTIAQPFKVGYNPRRPPQSRRMAELCFDTRVWRHSLRLHYQSQSKKHSPPLRCYKFIELRFFRLNVWTG